MCKTDGRNLEFIKDFGVNEYGSALGVNKMISSGDYIYIVTVKWWWGFMDKWRYGFGTYKIKDFSLCKNITDVNGRLFFTTTATFNGDEELWTSDGTETGTMLVKDICAKCSSSPSELINFNNNLFFTAYTEENGRELWKSDGTESGTILVADINPGIQSSIINANFGILNNELYFNANDGQNGFELWKTNGTEAGTSIVKDINVGYGSSFPARYKSSGFNIFSGPMILNMAVNYGNQTERNQERN